MHGHKLTPTRAPGLVVLFVALNGPVVADLDVVTIDRHVKRLARVGVNQPPGSRRHGPVEDRILEHFEDLFAALAVRLRSLLVQLYKLQCAVAANHQEVTLGDRHDHGAARRGDLAHKLPVFDIDDSDRLCRRHIENQKVPVVAQHADMTTEPQDGDLLWYLDLGDRREIVEVVNRDDVRAFAMNAARVIHLGCVDLAPDPVDLEARGIPAQRDQALHVARIGVVDIGAHARNTRNPVFAWLGERGGADLFWRDLRPRMRRPEQQARGNQDDDTHSYSPPRQGLESHRPKSSTA